MALLRYILICLLLGLLTGCHFTYLVKGGYYQAKILARQENIESALNKTDLKPEVRRKLELAKEVLSFMESNLGLQTKGNYRNFVQLDDKYVSYAVTAAEKFQLKPFLWKFPIVGSVPYKGYFVKTEADEEAKKLNEEGYDTLVRGVSAYSTLGWLKDPILSSMVNYRDEDFVNLLIHETVHANLYIKSAADFNEQLATFLANKGAETYFASRSDLKTTAIQYTRDAEYDEKLFSDFLSKETAALEEFYKNTSQVTAEAKAEKLKGIQERFTKLTLPKLKTGNYRRFGEETLNNAVLISYRTYLMDLSDFELAFAKFEGNFQKFLDFCKKLEKESDPRQAFKNFVQPGPG